MLFRSASGAVLGFTFATGAIGILVSGFLADQLGFDTVIIVAAVMVTLGGLHAGSSRSRGAPTNAAEAA